MEFPSESLSQPAREPAMPASDEALHRFLQTHDQAELEAMLRCVQLRLGTPRERSADMASAQAIAHQLNNLRTREDLADELGRFGRT